MERAAPWINCSLLHIYKYFQYTMQRDVFKVTKLCFFVVFAPKQEHGQAFDGHFLAFLRLHQLRRLIDLLEALPGHAKVLQTATRVWLARRRVASLRVQAHEYQTHCGELLLQVSPTELLSDEISQKQLTSFVAVILDKCRFL